MTNLTSTGTAVVTSGSRSNLEVILIARCAAVMQAATLDYSTANGTNNDLNDPIQHAILQTGGSVVSIVSVTDADVDTVATTRLNELLDIAELRVLKSVFGNYSAVGLKIGPRSEYQDQLASRLRARIKDMEKLLADQYGYGAAEAEMGVLTLDIAEHNASD